MYSFKTVVLLALGMAWLCSTGCQQEPSPPRSPDDELATFQLAPGLRIELVAAEPLVQEPVTMTFDADGRLWVVEMRGFMTDIDGTEEDLPLGRVSVLTDEDGDGQMDKSVIFIDSLVMPRAIALVEGGVLLAENQPLWFVEDADGDLRADKKTLLDPDYGAGGPPEHAPNGLWRGIDNWHYNAKSHYRYRLLDGKWVQDSTEFRGQWGISHDDAGRLFYNYNWSQLHADLVPPNYLSRNRHHEPTTGIDHGLTVDRSIFPIRENLAVNRGYIPGTLDENNRLLEFTAACSPFVYRESALPSEFKGNAFVCEPSGNLVKRNIVQSSGTQLSAYAAYPDKEFLASTDERFRPVALATGPDGALYVADMYRGIIQHGKYMTSYLRETTLKRNLEEYIHLGRIWRIVPENWQQPKPVRLSDATPQMLVEFLSNENGWYRDMAQRLLVERTIPEAIPLLENLAVNGEQELGRFHALWTLEGMRYTKPTVFFQALSDSSALVRTAAMRILEGLAKQNETVLKQLEQQLSQNWQQADEPTTVQLALTAGILRPSVRLPILSEIAKKFVASPLMRDAVLSSLQDYEFQLLQQLWQEPDWQMQDASKEIFLEMLAAAVANKGEPTELTQLLAKIDERGANLGWQEKAILSGMVINGRRQDSTAIELSKEPMLYTTMESFDAGVQSRISKLSNLFHWPGQVIDTARQQQQVLDEAAQQQFAAGRQQYLTVCASCHGNDGSGLKRFAPPLQNSEWVLGDEKKLTLILLHGLEGPVEVAGKLYNAPEILPVMPSLSAMDDADIAAILTYIRNEWGNTAPPIKARTVGEVRVMTQGKISPWTANELLNLPSDSKINTVN